MRIFRLALGIIIIVQGIQTGTWLFVALGAIFTLMPLLNIGCCAGSSCSVPVSKTNIKIQEVPYDEVH